MNDVYDMAKRLIATSSPESQIYQLSDALIKEHEHHVAFVLKVDKLVQRLMKFADKKDQYGYF